MNLSSQINDKVIQRFFDLYITAQYKYLIMDQEGRYRSFNSYNYDNHKPMGKWHIREHLEGKFTLGIFAAEYVTSFICFDIDIHNPTNAKWATYKLIDVLIKTGIPEEYIYISTSGNKGYHVDIYFKEALFNEVVKDFYNIVISKIDFTHIDGQIELRPTQQGLKLPLGTNFKNKNSKANKCWYVDYNEGLQPIKNYEYILSIKQIDPDIIKNIIESENDIEIYEHKAEKEEATQIENTKGYLTSKYQSLDSYKKNVDNETTIENAQKIELEGLQGVGTRHNSTYNLCKYYKYLGYTLKENKQKLIEWINEQDTRLYTTDIKECYKDINEIVKYIYDKDINLVQANKEIIITYDDMLDILKVKSKNEKLLLYALLIHSKRYANEKGIFYMTYSQMVLSTGLGERTVKRLVNKLNDYKAIDIIERNRKVLDNKGNLITKRPNKYKVILTNNEIDINEINYITIDDNEYVNFNNALLMFFDKPELKKVLPDRHYRELNIINTTN